MAGTPQLQIRDRIVGCIWGGAIGDALGLPYEGLSPRRGLRLLGPPEKFRFLAKRGMFSDDTEHTCLVVQSLVQTGGASDPFARDLAWRLRWWLLGLPAGIGRATLTSIVKLWLGARPGSSGVFSAGNGPAMRAAILGVAFQDPASLKAVVRESSRLTHTDPKAEYGALCVALAARISGVDPGVLPGMFLEQAQQLLGQPADELLQRLERVVASVHCGQSTRDFAAEFCPRRGVTGYTYQTVPVAIHAWLSSPTDFQKAVRTVIQCGGDTDTTAAIVGGIVGAAVGPSGIPAALSSGILEWPRTLRWLEQLGEQLAQVLETGNPQTPLRLPAWGLLPRNALFMAVVLAHGFRRLLPPY